MTGALRGVVADVDRDVPVSRMKAGVVRLMLRQAVVVTVIGLAAGIPLTIAGGRAVSSMLYGVEPIDPASLAAAAVLISVVSGLAAYLPARRAPRLEPLSALRCDYGRLHVPFLLTSKRSL